MEVHPKTRYRLVVDITPEQHEKLDRYFQHGERKRFFGVLLDDVIEKLDKFGPIVLGAYMRRRLALGDLSPMFDVGDKDGND